MAHAPLLWLAAAGAALYTLPALSGIPAVGRRLPSGLSPDDTGDVHLTFDDGPHPDGTAAILDVLSEFHATATFFVIGEQASRRAQLCRRIVDAGNEIAIHGWDHRCLLRVGPTATACGIERTASLVSDLVGVRPARYRPPYGIMSLQAIGACRRAGLTPTWWDVWGRDWSRRATTTSVHRRIDQGLHRPASTIVLLHDSDAYGTPGSWRITAAATRVLLENWTSAGAAIRSLADGAAPPSRAPEAPPTR